jgi:ferredoxin
MASLDLKWWHAQANLGWRAFVHYFSKLWPWRARYGLERFRANYVHEGLPPAAPAHRALAHEPGRCTACGNCDSACPVLHDHDLQGFIGPMAFVVGGARSGPHLPDVRETLRILNGPLCADCRACDAACPERIPITAIAAALAEQLEVIDGARALGGHAPPRALGPRQEG